MGEFDNLSVGSQDVVDLEDELRPVQLNTQVISNVYQQELGDQIEAIAQFRNGLQESSSYYRQEDQPGLQREGKVEKVEQMKDYIHQSLAYIAYTTTIATQKIDEGLKLQCDDLDRLGSAIGEIGIQAPWSTIAVIEDPDSPWKKVPPKYHRTPIDFTILDDVGLIGAGSASKPIGGRSHSIRSDRRTSVSTTLSHTSSRFSAGTTRRAKAVGQPQRAPRPVAPPGSPGLTAAKSGNGGPPPPGTPPGPGGPPGPPQAPPSSGAGLPPPPTPPPVGRQESLVSVESCASSQREPSPPRTPTPILSRKKGSGREASRMSIFVPDPDDPMTGVFGKMNNESNDLPELLPEEDEEDMNRLPTPPPDPSFEDLPPLPF